MNDNEPGAAATRTAIENEADFWFSRMRNEEAPAFRDEFEAWIGKSSDHADAYRRVKRTFDESEALKRSEKFGVTRHQRVKGWRVAGLAVAAAIVLGIIVGPARQPRPSISGAPLAQTVPDMTTGHGEIRTFRLSDGSNMTLDSDSRAEVAMSGAERRVRLRAGKARFAVASDPRPFVVEAGAGSVDATTAEFDVGFGGNRQIEVNLYSGKAGLSAITRPAVYTVASMPLLTGQPVRYPAADFKPVPAPDTGTDRKDWPSGWVEYRSIALADLITEANRYASRPVILDDPDPGTLTASGRFKLSDTKTFVSRIAELFDLSVSREPDGIHLRRK